MPDVIEQVDFDARYTVAGFGGVAFQVIGYAEASQYEGDYLVCDDDECDHMLSAMCWAEGDTSIVIDHDWVRAIMVGDDYPHLVEVSQLTKISEDDYCHGCGQIGCAW